MWFIGVEVEQGTSAPPPKKNPGSAPVIVFLFCLFACLFVTMREGHSKPSFCNQRSKWQKWKSETFGSVGSTGVTEPMILQICNLGFG